MNESDISDEFWDKDVTKMTHRDLWVVLRCDYGRLLSALLYVPCLSK